MHALVRFWREGVHRVQKSVERTAEREPRTNAVAFKHSRCIHNRAWLDGTSVWLIHEEPGTSLTGRDIEHIPEILFRWNWRTLLTSDKRLEQSNDCTVDIAGNKSHPNTAVPGQTLQIGDEIVSFPLRGSDSAIHSSGKKIFEYTS